MTLEESITSTCSLRNSPLVRDFLAEALGTFIMMVFGIGSVAQSVLSGSSSGTFLSINFSWGLGVALGVSASAGVTGGHINPAITVAMAILGRLDVKRLPSYVFGQYFGSFVASYFVYLVYNDALDHFDGGERHVTGSKGSAHIWSTYPQDYVSNWTGLGDQILSTGMLQISFMALIDFHHFAPGSQATPFCMGAVVIVIGMSFGLNCFYAINPARDLAPRIFTAVAGWGYDPFSYRDYKWFWVPVVGPHIGAVLGALTYQLAVGSHW